MYDKTVSGSVVISNIYKVTEGNNLSMIGCAHVQCAPSHVYKVLRVTDVDFDDLILPAVEKVLILKGPVYRLPYMMHSIDQGKG